MNSQNPAFAIDRLSDNLARISSNHASCVFDRDRVTVFELPRSLEQNVLSELINLNIPLNVSNNYNAKNSINPFPDKKHRKSLKRLTINVSDNCNLKCLYCYAEFGKYGNGLKQFQCDINSVVSKIIYFYDDIENIMFFGGEPLIAINRIDLLCSSFKVAFEHGLIKRLPIFGAVTNGTMLTKQRVINVIKKHNISLTVSSDGPPSINNRTRVPANTNVDISRKIDQGIYNLQSNGIAFGIEGTYTSLHQKYGVTVIDMLDFFAEKYKCGVVHIPSAINTTIGHYRPDNEQAIKCYFDASYESARRIVKGRNGILRTVHDIFVVLSRRSARSVYCPAFDSQISLNMNGDVYPCFMAMGNDENRLGNIVQDEWPTSRCKEALARYQRQMNSGQVGRRVFWFDSLVGGCAAADQISTGHFGDPENHQTSEAIVAGTLLGLSTELKEEIA